MEPTILLLSSSNVHGYEYLQHAKESILTTLKSKNISKILLIPYAVPNADSFVKKFSTTLNSWGFDVESILEKDPTDAVKSAEAIFMSGGNTFLLLTRLYEEKLIEILRERVLNDGLLYMGVSAGSNVAGMAINTTNDMPIIYPPSFNGLQLIPFIINPHYLDADPNSTHKGETREERILQYHELPNTYTVLGIREGAIISINNKTAMLLGVSGARLFQKEKSAEEIAAGEDISYLLTKK